MEHSTRRRLLRAAGTVGVGAFAGCAGGGARRTARTDRESDAETTTAEPDGSTPMVRIEGGTYTVGTDTGPEDARPAHQVQVQPFRIDEFEVTNERFAAFLDDLDIAPVGDAPPGEVTSEDLPSGDARRLLEGPEGEEQRPLAALDDDNSRIGISDGRFVVEDGYADHPVNEVTWDGARAFADWRGARLPTEAEWEAAARGFEGRLYPWGDAPPTPERAVYGRPSGETAPVGTHPQGATPTGIQDMAGNVSEWTSSLYRPYPYDAADGREDPDVRGERVTRGGAHVFFGPDELRAYYRTGFSREFDRGHRHIGFRCARSSN